MAQITITIPDAILARVITGVSTANRYQTRLPTGLLNPETPTAFAYRMLQTWIREQVKSTEAVAAADAARTAALAAAELAITVTVS